MEKLYSYKNVIEKGWWGNASRLYLAFLTVAFLNMTLYLDNFKKCG